MVWKRSCIVCKSNTNLFSFPTDEISKRKWTEAIEVDSESILPQRDKVCGAHFSSDQFKNNNLRRLKNDARPTLREIFETVTVDHHPRNESDETIIIWKTKFQCYICGYIFANSSFTFPKNLAEREKWAKFCGIEVEEIKKHYRLCDIHFEPNDFRITKDRPLLKQTSVPTLFPRIGEKNCTKVAYQSLDPSNAFQVQALNSSRNEKLPTTSMKWDDCLPQDHLLVELQVESENEDLVTPPNSIVNDDFTPSRKYFKYFGDIKEQDVETSSCAKLALKMGKEEVQKYRKKISQLQSKNVKLKKKLNNLSELINDLKQKNLLSQHAAQTILANIL